MTRALGAGIFVVLLAAGVVLEVRARRDREHPQPTFAGTIDWLGALPGGRLLLFGIWVFSGWHFFVR